MRWWDYYRNYQLDESDTSKNDHLARYISLNDLEAYYVKIDNYLNSLQELVPNGTNKEDWMKYKYEDVTVYKNISKDFIKIVNDLIKFKKDNLYLTEIDNYLEYAKKFQQLIEDYNKYNLNIDISNIQQIKDAFKKLKEIELEVNNQRSLNRYLNGQGGGALQKLTVKELRERCAKRKIPYSGKRKAELIAALRKK